jgi:hypothetical protein
VVVDYGFRCVNLALIHEEDTLVGCPVVTRQAYPCSSYIVLVGEAEALDIYFS